MLENFLKGTKGTELTFILSTQKFKEIAITFDLYLVKKILKINHEIENYIGE